MLHGKLWLLVSGKVFSSSELAASFAKDTGLFTLAGDRTGGGGLSSDPLPYVLQNSGLVIRYTMELGLTPDGANNQEHGTVPDHIPLENESTLDTCLRIIDSQNG